MVECNKEWKECFVIVVKQRRGRYLYVTWDIKICSGVDANLRQASDPCQVPAPGGCLKKVSISHVIGGEARAYNRWTDACRVENSPPAYGQRQARGSDGPCAFRCWVTGCLGNNWLPRINFGFASFSARTRQPINPALCTYLKPVGKKGGHSCDLLRVGLTQISPPAVSCFKVVVGELSFRLRVQ